MRGVKGTGPYGKGRGKGKKKSGSEGDGRRIKRRHLKPAGESPMSQQPMFVPNVIVLTPEAVGAMVGVAISKASE
jgi:hypothetical protein